MYKQTRREFLETVAAADASSWEDLAALGRRREGSKMHLLGRLFRIPLSIIILWVVPMCYKSDCILWGVVWRELCIGSIYGQGINPSIIEKGWGLSVGGSVLSMPVS